MKLYESIKNNLKEATELTKFKWRDGLEDFDYYVDKDKYIYAKNKNSGRLYLCTDDGDPETEIEDDENYIIKESDEPNENLRALNELLGEWDFIVDVTDPYISSIDIDGDKISISCELWDPDLDDYVSIDGGEYEAPEIVDMINKADFFQDRDTMSYYNEANDILTAIAQKTDWNAICDKLYDELHKQRREEGYEDEDGNIIEDAEHPLDWKKYEVTIKRNDARGNFTTIVVNKSEDAVRDYITGKGYEVVNIKELGYPGGNPENKNELQNKANKVVRNMAKMRESQTQEIDAVLKALKEKNPNIEKYLNEYYKAIADTEPRPAYDKEKDKMDPAWENWNKTTNNVLYSREAWENFTNWVKEKYGENLNEAEMFKEAGAAKNKDFYCEWCGTDFNAMPKSDGTMPNCPHCIKDRYKDDPEKDADGHANKDVHFTDAIGILDEDEYNALDYYLDYSKLYDSGFYLVQDPGRTDYFVDLESDDVFNLRDGISEAYVTMVPESIAKFPKKVQAGLEKLIRHYLGDGAGDEIKNWAAGNIKYGFDESEKTNETDPKWFCIICGKKKEDYEAAYCDECWEKEKARLGEAEEKGIENGKSYWAYVSKHGLGPGTIPNDVEAALVTDLPETGKTLFCVDRQLTPEELDKYELALFDNSYFNKYPEVVKELMALK